MKDKFVGYSIFLFSLLILSSWATFTVWGLIKWNSWDPNVPFITQELTIILLAAPIILGVIAVLSIAAWIGWTMARTPPPAPIDLEDFEPSEEKVPTKTEEKAVVKKPSKKKNT